MKTRRMLYITNRYFLLYCILLRCKFFWRYSENVYTLCLKLYSTINNNDRYTYYYNHDTYQMNKVYFCGYTERITPSLQHYISVNICVLKKSNFSPSLAVILINNFFFFFIFLSRKFSQILLVSSTNYKTHRGLLSKLLRVYSLMWLSHKCFLKKNYSVYKKISCDPYTIENLFNF